MEKPDEPTPPTDAAKVLEELKSLPSLEDTKIQVQSAMDQITTAASKIIPTIVWETGNNAETDSCQRPYEQTDGKRYFLPNRFAENVTVSENDWSEILNVAKASAAKIGATDVQVFHDQPGKHDVGFYGPTGIYIKVGYMGNLGVSGYTGCRLSGDKK